MSDGVAMEVLVLTKLLRRNYNQHGHTKLHQHLKQLKNKLLFYHEINEFDVAMQKCLNVAGKNAKLSILELNMLIDCIDDLTKVVSITVDCVREVILCNELVKQQLDQLIFVPLNTIFTALLGRIATLLLHFYSVYVKNKEILVPHLQHIKLTQSRYKELIEKSLVRGVAEPRHFVYASKRKRIDQIESVIDIMLPRAGLLVNDGIDCDSLTSHGHATHAGDSEGCGYRDDSDINGKKSDDGSNDDNYGRSKYKVIRSDDSVQRKRKSKKKAKRDSDDTGIDAIFSGV